MQQQEEAKSVPQQITVTCVTAVTRKRLVAACMGVGVFVREVQSVPAAGEDTYILTLAPGEFDAAEAARRLSGCRKTVQSAHVGSP